MQTILCINCNSSFQIDETRLKSDSTSINCPFCQVVITIKNEQTPLLISCPECQNNIPEKSTICTSCGYPIKKIDDLNQNLSITAYQKAVNLLNNGKAVKAKTKLMIAINLFPDNEEYKELNNKIDLDIERQDMSEEFYSTAVDLFKSKDYDKAISEIETAIKLYNHSDYLSLKNKILGRIENEKNAEKLYFDALEAFTIKKEYQHGLNLIEEALSLTPDNAEYKLLQEKLTKSRAELKYEDAQQYFTKKEFNASRNLINECLELIPNEPKFVAFKKKILMKKRKKVLLISSAMTVGALVCLALAIFFLSYKKDKDAWLEASQTKSSIGCEQYLTSFPDGRYSEDAYLLKDSIAQIEKPDWNKTLQTNTPKAYNSFIIKHPNSIYTETAIEKKWIGTYVPDEKFSNDEIFEIVIHPDLHVSLRTPTSLNQIGKADILSADEISISFNKKVIRFVKQGKVYQSFTVYSLSKPAIILSEVGDVIYTGLPQSNNYSERKSHPFFKRKGTNEVSLVDKADIKNLITKFVSDADSKNFQSFGSSFAPVVKRFYDKLDVSNDEIIEQERQYWEKTDIIKGKGFIDYKSFNIRLDDSSNFIVSFNMDYKCQRREHYKPNWFNVNKYLIIGQDFKIRSIRDSILLLKHIPNFMIYSGFSDDYDFGDDSDFLYDNKDIENWNKLESSSSDKNWFYSLSYPSDWVKIDGANGVELALFPKNPKNSDWWENINLIVHDLNTSYSLDNCVSQELNLVRKNTANFSLKYSETLKLKNKIPLHLLIYTFKYETLYLKCMQCIIVVHNRAYVLTFTAKIDDYDSLIMKASQILDTFTVK